MLKTTFTLILFLFLSSCGYKAIHSKKNNNSYDFSISKLNFIGDRNINLRIKEKLNNYTLNKKNKDFILNISSSVERVIIAKDASGDPTSFKTTIIVDAEVLVKNNLKNNLQITESFNYNNDTNKFNLKKYEKEIVNNLTEVAASKLIYELSNIQ
jgi:outer membrane lipopolysaccharide assembly protein LptE/RlpB